MWAGSKNLLLESKFSEETPPNGSWPFPTSGMHRVPSRDADIDSGGIKPLKDNSQEASLLIKVRSARGSPGECVVTTSLLSPILGS